MINTKNSTRIGLIGDTHHGVKNGNHAMRAYQKDMLLNYIIPHYKSIGVLDLVDMGDFFDNRRYVLGLDWYWLKEELIPLLAENSMTLHMTIGNHTISLKDGVEINHCKILEDLSIAHGSHCVKSYTHPTEVEFDDLKVLFLPWCASGNYKEVVSAVEESEASVVLTHVEFKGFILTKGKLCEHEVLSTTMFEKFDAVYSGHLHIGSEKVLQSGTVVKFLGIPYEQCWGDVDSCTDNGIYTLDCLTQKLEFIPNPEGSSIFKIIEYNYTNIASTKSGKKWLTKEHLESELHLKDKVIRINVTDRSNSSHYKNFLSALRLVKCVNFNVVDLTKEIETFEQDVTLEEVKTSTLQVLLDKVEDTEGINHEGVADKLNAVHKLCVDKSNLI